MGRENRYLLVDKDDDYRGTCLLESEKSYDEVEEIVKEICSSHDAYTRDDLEEHLPEHNIEMIWWEEEISW